MQALASKMCQTLMLLDDKIEEEEALSKEIDDLSDQIYLKAGSLVKRQKKEKKTNRKFQETMIKELGNLNKALLLKKKKKRSGSSFLEESK